MRRSPESGVYVLVIEVQAPSRIKAGALSSMDLRQGFYAYVGKAGRGLAARLERHARSHDKRPHWHVDYLLEEAPLREIWVFSLSRGECPLAADLESAGGSREGLKGFGSSDCRCRGHLLYLGAKRPEPPREALNVFRDLKR